MDFLQIVMIALHMMHVATKSRSKHYESSSEEDSIENLLYFKDCQRKSNDPPPPVVPLANPLPPPPPPPPKNDCPFPKMCCALTCGNECGGSKEPSFMNRQMEPMHTMVRHGIEPMQPMMQPIQPNQMLPVQPQLRKRKRIKFPPGTVQLPKLTRRLGFTKEKIKSLINQDDDIRNILKDLVRVTMQKVNNEVDDPHNDKDSYTNIRMSTSTTLAAYEDYDEFID